MNYLDQPGGATLPFATSGTGGKTFSTQQVFAGMLFACLLPAYAVIGVMVWISSGRPILYRGERLGRNRKPFTLRKFRTMRSGAQKELGASLVNGGTSQVTPFGRWLRDTRLDELPQLWNIVTGDMSFVGPRPERPEVYAKVCREIPGYEKRFMVKPGLVGYAQVFTPHGTPKCVRTKVDNLVSFRPRSESDEFLFVTYTGWLVVRTTVRKCLEIVVYTFASPKRRRAMRLRRLKRVRLNRAHADVDWMTRSGDKFFSREKVQLVDINEEALRIRSTSRLPALPSGEMRLSIGRKGKDGREKVATARCVTQNIQVRKTEQGVDYVVRYTPTSPRSDYMIQRYFLKQSIDSVSNS